MDNVKTKLFAILWLAGMSGVLSILLIDLPALIASLPVAAGSEIPLPLPLVKLLGIIQPTILLSIAIFTGLQLAPAVGLSAPASEALARGDSFASALKPQILPGLIFGLVTGIVLLASWILFRPSLPQMFVTRAEKFNTLIPFLTRLLYGGITEELLLRWGVLTLLVWIFWRVFQQGRGKPRAINFVAAIVISSVIFGIGHLPIVRALELDFTLPIVAFIVSANSMFGLIAGYLYWRKGLESAIIAHMTAHVVLVTAIKLAM
jgi:membrane protease YdiL (CAAX protease family)